MLKLSLFTFFLLFVSMLIAQKDGAFQKGRLDFNVGPEYRITPIYTLENLMATETDFTNIDKQNAGTALNAGLEFFAVNNFSISLTNSFRYDLVISPIPEQSQTINTASADYKILLDYHLGLSWYFSVFNDGKAFVGAGLSLMNRNSDFTVRENVLDGNDNVIGFSHFIYDFQFTASKVSIGYAKGRFKFSVGTYMAKSTPYFEESTSFIVPQFSIDYRINKN